MLQELACSKGPRLPTSIQSTSHSIKCPDTTLMRITLYHGILEFWISGSWISGSQVLDLRVMDLRTGRSGPCGFGLKMRQLQHGSNTQGPAGGYRTFKMNHAGIGHPVLVLPVPATLGTPLPLPVLPAPTPVPTCLRKSAMGSK